MDLTTSRSCLSRLRGRRAATHISLYAKNVTILLEPLKHDVDQLTAILQSFDHVHMLMHEHPKKQGRLDCSLEVKQLKRALEAKIANILVPWEGKPSVPHSVELSWAPVGGEAAQACPRSQIADILVPWDGKNPRKNMMAAGRGILLKSLLTTHDVYHLTLLPVLPGVL